MNHIRGAIILALGVTAGAAGAYWYARPPAAMPVPVALSPSAAPAAERKILYYRDPSGTPYWSGAPKKDANGRDYLPVYDDDKP